MIQQAKCGHPVDAKSSVIFPVYEEGHFCSKLAAAIGYDYSDEICKKQGEITKISTMGKLPYANIYVVGLGSEKCITAEKLMSAFGKAAKCVKEKEISIALKPATTDTITLNNLALLVSEAVLTATYEFTKITGKEKEEISFELVSGEDISKEIAEGKIIADAINHARTLGNTPSNYMTPIDLAAYAEALGKECNLETTILTNKELEKMGAGALLGVNKGSAHEARLIVLKYNGGGEKEYNALVGKGLTFDSGGYNLKSAAGMTGMKYDMCGGAAVLGAMEIIAKKKLPINVYGIVPATENMISGEAYKCDDVLVSLSGKTIEVTNTDAEGRIILCDAITYAIQQGAKRIVDVATLTGACRIAVGELYTGAFSNSEDFYQALDKAAKASHEKIWRLPLDEGYAAYLKKSNVADIVNSPGKGPGATIGAEFLHAFVEEGVEWIHLDVATTAQKDAEHDLGPRGATGAMVKTMATIFE